VANKHGLSLDLTSITAKQHVNGLGNGLSREHESHRPPMLQTIM